MNPFSGQATAPWVAYEQLQQVFGVEELEADIDAVPEDIDVLLLVHPKTLSEAALFAIDQFVLRGGKLMAFIDPVAESDQSMEAMMDGMADGRASDLAPLLAAWGVSYDPERVVLDSDRKSTRLNSSHVRISYA